MGGACSVYVETGGHRVVMSWSEGKRPLQRSRCRWEDNIEMDLKVTEWENMEWIHLAQVRDK